MIKVYIWMFQSFIKIIFLLQRKRPLVKRNRYSMLTVQWRVKKRKSWRREKTDQEVEERGRRGTQRNMQRNPRGSWSITQILHTKNIKRLSYLFSCIVKSVLLSHCGIAGADHDLQYMLQSFLPLLFTTKIFSPLMALLKTLNTHAFLKYINMYL